MLQNILSKSRRDANLTDFQKVLFSEFVLNEESRKSTNDELSRLLVKSASSVTKSISVLAELGYINPVFGFNNDRVIRVSGISDNIPDPIMVRPKAPPKPGFVYLMINDKTLRHKIGHSKTPRVRETTLQSEDPFVRMVAYWPGTVKDEKELHNMFAEKRFRGEWFDLSCDDIVMVHLFFTSKTANK